MFFVFCDAATSWQIGLQDPATPVAEGIIRFHHDLIFIIIFVVIFVSWIISRILFHFNKEKNPSISPTNVVHGTTIEVIWTLIPALLLIVIAVPSFALLYSVDEIVDPSLTIKVIARQWGWNYEYSDYVIQTGNNLSFDSYLLDESDLENGHLRLLEVDNRVVVPVDTHVRLIVTSSDVLHSWSVPSFGIKVDACPGRLNETSLFVQRPGVFYGQCSEICGVNHGFIPIVVESYELNNYVNWVNHIINEI